MAVSEKQRANGRRLASRNKGNTYNQFRRQTLFEIRKIVEDGKILPVEVMIMGMRHHWDKFNQPVQTVEEQAEAERHLAIAMIYAEKAAPYLHAKLTSVEMKIEDKSSFVKPEEIPSYEAGLALYQQENGM